MLQSIRCLNCLDNGSPRTSKVHPETTSRLIPIWSILMTRLGGNSVGIRDCTSNTKLRASPSTFFSSLRKQRETNFVTFLETILFSFFHVWIKDRWAENCIGGSGWGKDWFTRMAQRCTSSSWTTKWFSFAFLNMARRSLLILSNFSHLDPPSFL